MKQFFLLSFFLLIINTNATTVDYPPIKLVDVNTVTTPFADIKKKCGPGYQLVSIQNPAHVIWLSDQIEKAKGQNYIKTGSGIPLGYDYKQDNTYSDLNDENRSVQWIFNELRSKHGWKGDYHSNQVSTLQWYAGFGWSYHGIEDWSPIGYNHPTKAIICEQMYPSIKMIGVNNKNFPLSNLKSKCELGYRPVSIQSPEHVMWLSNQVEKMKGKNVLSTNAGIPLGYDYKRDNTYSDFNDENRSVQWIFNELRSKHGWKGDYHSNQVSGNQWYAGFGWNYHGIEDWGPQVHTTSFVICEKMFTPYLWLSRGAGICPDLHNVGRESEEDTLLKCRNKCETFNEGYFSIYEEDGEMVCGCYKDCDDLLVDEKKFKSGHSYEILSGTVLEQVNDLETSLTEKEIKIANLMAEKRELEELKIYKQRFEKVQELEKQNYLSKAAITAHPEVAIGEFMQFEESELGATEEFLFDGGSSARTPDMTQQFLYELGLLCAGATLFVVVTKIFSGKRHGDEYKTLLDV